MTVGVRVFPEDLFASDATAGPCDVDPDAEEGPCEALDDLIINLLVERTLRARDHHAARAEAGLPERKMSWEYAMVKRYGARLGPEGAEIARAALAMAHSRRPLPPDA